LALRPGPDPRPGGVVAHTNRPVLIRLGRSGELGQVSAHREPPRLIPEEPITSLLARGGIPVRSDRAPRRWGRRRHIRPGRRVRRLTTTTSTAADNISRQPATRPTGPAPVDTLVSRGSRPRAIPLIASPSPFFDAHRRAAVPESRNGARPVVGTVEPLPAGPHPRTTHHRPRLGPQSTGRLPSTGALTGTRSQMCVQQCRPCREYCTRP